MFLTAEGDLFNRTFRNHEYFYCENCKQYTFYRYNESVCEEDECIQPCVKDESNATHCSEVHMKKAIIYIGDPSKGNSKAILVWCGQHALC